MPAATLVIFAFPPILARITSWRGPLPFFHTPTISIGTGSGSIPSNTVQAVPVIPGLISLSRKISTLPALGRMSSAAEITELAVSAKAPATSHLYMKGKLPLLLIYYRDYHYRRRGY